MQRGRSCLGCAVSLIPSQGRGTSRSCSTSRLQPLGKGTSTSRQPRAWASICQEWRTWKGSRWKSFPAPCTPPAPRAWGQALLGHTLACSGMGSQAREHRCSHCRFPPGQGMPRATTAPSPGPATSVPSLHTPAPPASCLPPAPHWLLGRMKRSEQRRTGRTKQHFGEESAIQAGQNPGAGVGLPNPPHNSFHLPLRPWGSKRESR